MLRRNTRTTWNHGGSDPDYRFSLANERTFLAWVRTILALLATVAVFDQLAMHAANPWTLRVACIALATIACVASGRCYFKWRANEFSMRHAKTLPHSFLQPLIGIVVFGVAIVLAIHTAK